MPDKLIMNSARMFYDLIVTPACKEFFDTQSSFRTMFNVATALFHMRDWLYVHNRTELEKHFQLTFASGSKLWHHIEQQESKAKYIRDVANASKHVVLTIRPSTTMTHIANTYIESSTYGAGGYGTGRYGAPNAKMDDGGQPVSFDDCAMAVKRYWDELLVKIAV